MSHRRILDGEINLTIEGLKDSSSFHYDHLIRSALVELMILTNPLIKDKKASRNIALQHSEFVQVIVLMYELCNLLHLPSVLKEKIIQLGSENPDFVVWQILFNYYDYTLVSPSSRRYILRPDSLEILHKIFAHMSHHQNGVPRMMVRIDRMLNPTYKEFGGMYKQILFYSIREHFIIALQNANLTAENLEVCIKKQVQTFPSKGLVGFLSHVIAICFKGLSHKIILETSIDNILIHTPTSIYSAKEVPCLDKTRSMVPFKLLSPEASSNCLEQIGNVPHHERHLSFSFDYVDWLSFVLMNYLSDQMPTESLRLRYVGEDADTLRIEGNPSSSLFVYGLCPN